MKKLLLLLFISVSTIFANEAKTVAVATLEKLISKNAIIIDIRAIDKQKEEGIIPNSYRIPFDSFEEKKLKKWKYNLTKVVKSAHQSFALVSEDGKIAEKLANELVKAGYKKVYFLKGGFNSWKNEDKKVVF
ncbi:rhodanese-like domain-containing protein [Malaciobacter mytili]|uniref:Rhodanese domain-containing protein n=1 Tax=Malaciobacter mytili LMG 24559 TaxID=1032238 RepID=A0AAX2AHJ8_9BACT|nr:rhodanese-like domain-containing protein [Malaciobacter mytili]AXH16096.1 rhodanese-like domain-containing protein [Malaciobacter mytili LMG 24559]RXK14926.1 hypothetical protein CP985_11200 [Malaciobacter mytili LMG 24559]